MKFYRELALGSCSTRGLVVPVTEIAEYAKLARRDNKELYASYYSFDQDLVDHFKLFKTIKSFSGKYYLNNLILDVDPGEHMEKIIKTIHGDLIEMGFDVEFQIGWWFSGRGFHITVPWQAWGMPVDGRRDLPGIVKATAAKYFPMADNIYDGARLIRVGNTVNIKTDLYKIRIPQKALFNGSWSDVMLKIQAWARDPGIAIDGELPDITTASLPHIVPIFPSSAPSTAVSSSLLLEDTHSPADDPSRFVTCMQKLYMRGPVSGRRHTDMLRLVSAWQRNGVPPPGIKLMLHDWVKGEIMDYELDRVIASVAEKGYRYSCTDSVMMEYCDSKCVFAKSKTFGSDVITSGTAEKKLVEFIRTLDDTTSFNLKHIFPGFPDFVIGGGEVVIFWADTGLGKSALAQNIAINVPHIKVLYCCLEMGPEITFRRLVQIKHGMSKDDVLTHYRTHDNTYSKDLDHISIVHIPPTIKDIRRIVADMRPHLVIVDVIDAILTPGVIDENPRMALIINSFRDIAVQQSCAVLGIHHISKSAALDLDGKTRPLSIHSGKGTSAIEQKADTVIGMELVKPKFGGPLSIPPGLELRTVKTLKTRDNPPFSRLMTFDPDTFIFQTYTREELTL